MRSNDCGRFSLFNLRQNEGIRSANPMPESVIPAETMNAWKSPLSGSKLEKLGRLSGGHVDGINYSSGREVADALINSRPQGAGGGISKANPEEMARSADPAKLEFQAGVE